MFGDIRWKEYMGVEGLDTAATGKRREKRSRVLLSARLRTLGGDVDVRLRDLSRKGALVECNISLSVGEEVVFSRGATIVPARVAWASGDRVGLEFLRMIEESELLVHVSRAPAPTIPEHQQQQRFRRPRLLSEDLSEQERKLARLWATAVGISVPD